jgi:hypothetical protein
MERDRRMIGEREEREEKERRERESGETVDRTHRMLQNVTE